MTLAGSNYGTVFNPIKYLIHDFDHAEVMQGTRIPTQYKKEWIILNETIPDKISKLKGLEKKATEALCFLFCGNNRCLEINYPDHLGL